MAWALRGIRASALAAPNGSLLGSITTLAKYTCLCLNLQSNPHSLHTSSTVAGSWLTQGSLFGSLTTLAKYTSLSLQSSPHSLHTFHTSSTVAGSWQTGADGQSPLEYSVGRINELWIAIDRDQEAIDILKKDVEDLKLVKKEEEDLKRQLNAYGVYIDWANKFRKLIALAIGKTNREPDTWVILSEKLEHEENDAENDVWEEGKIHGYLKRMLADKGMTQGDWILLEQFSSGQNHFSYDAEWDAVKSRAEKGEKARRDLKALEGMDPNLNQFKNVLAQAILVTSSEYGWL